MWKKWARYQKQELPQCPWMFHTPSTNSGNLDLLSRPKDLSSHLLWKGGAQYQLGAEIQRQNTKVWRNLKLTNLPAAVSKFCKTHTQTKGWKLSFGDSLPPSDCTVMQRRRYPEGGERQNMSGLGQIYVTSILLSRVMLLKPNRLVLVLLCIRNKETDQPISPFLARVNKSKLGLPQKCESAEPGSGPGACLNW